MYWKALLSIGLTVQWPRGHYVSSCGKESCRSHKQERRAAAGADDEDAAGAPAAPGWAHC